MKKFLLMVLTFFLLTISVLGYAKNPEICALLIAEPDMKTEDFMNKVHDCLKDNTNVVFGTEIQTKYQEYWLSKGQLEEGKPTPEVLFEFRKYSGYKKCLYIITDVKTEKSSVPAGLFGLARVERTRASVNIKGFLVGEDITGTEKILKVISATEQADSETSDLRAKRGAFERSMKKLVKEFDVYLQSRK